MRTKLDENPYLPPIHAGHHHAVTRASRTTAIVVLFATIGFWFGLLLAALGSVISFVPGAECGWYLVAGVLLSLGLLPSKRHYRIAAMILALLCFAYAYSGYVRGGEYRKWLNGRDAVSRLHAAQQSMLAESGIHDGMPSPAVPAVMRSLPSAAMQVSSKFPSIHIWTGPNWRA